jgi:hypothetical protein
LRREAWQLLRITADLGTPRVAARYASSMALALPSPASDFQYSFG